MSDTDTLKAQDGAGQDSSAGHGLGLNEMKLKAAGLSYMLGDVALTAANVIADRKETTKNLGSIITGRAGGTAVWFIGGVAAAIFGNPNIETQLKIHGSRLQDYLEKRGVKIPDDERQRNKLLKKRSFWDHTLQFLHEHPSEMLNLAYGIGAAMLLRDGHKAIWVKKEATLFPKSFDLAGFNKMATDFWMGALILPGALIGLLAHEDHQPKQKSEENRHKGFIEYITEKPLRMSGALYAANNVFLGLKTITNFDKMKRGSLPASPFYLAALTLACYLFSNAMLFMSDRDQMSKKGFDPESVAKLEDAGARVIAAQPPEVQKQLLEDVSKHIASQKGITIDAPTLASHMAKRIGELTNGRLQETAATMKWTARENARVQETPNAPVIS